MQMGQFTWSELIALLAVTISFATICINTFSNTKKEIQSEQKTFDKLDNLSKTSSEIRDTVKLMNAKLDDHSVRITQVEVELKNVNDRVNRIERNVV